eukprot:scaffold351273_cov18-Prasinocladus_malaysianus.AAC.2
MSTLATTVRINYEYHARTAAAGYGVPCSTATCPQRRDKLLIIHSAAFQFSAPSASSEALRSTVLPAACLSICQFPCLRRLLRLGGTIAYCTSVLLHSKVAIKPA